MLYFCSYLTKITTHMYNYVFMFNPLKYHSIFFLENKPISSILLKKDILYPYLLIYPSRQMKTFNSVH